METIVKSKEKPIIDNICEILKTLTPKQQEEMAAFIQGTQFGRRIERQLQSTGT